MKKLYILIFALSIYQSSSFAQNGWQSKFNGQAWLNTVHFPTSSTGWAAGSFGVIYKTTNGGDNWIGQHVASGLISINSLYFVSPLTGWVVGYEGAIFLTTDGGFSWTSRSTGNPDDNLSSVFAGGSTAWIVGSNGFDEVILKTTNLGANWISQSSGANKSLSSVHFVNIFTGWAVGGYETNVILKTTNGGTNWTEQQSGTNEPLFSVFFRSSSTGWTVGGNGTILNTTNGGANWTPQLNGSNAAFYSVHFPTLTTGWAVAQFGKIVKTTNGGTNWISQISGTSNWLTSVYFVSPTTGFTVGGYLESSIILKTTNGGIAPLNLNLSGLIEGLYDSNSGFMKGDTVNVYLRNSASPYLIIDSAKKYLDSTGHCALSFFNAVNSTPYYIVIKHRNSIETWSGSAVSFALDSLTYDFKSAASQAYGNNLVLKGTKYCFYGGDADQSGVVDASDLALIDNDAFNFVMGAYVITDLNFDNQVDGVDLAIGDNNAYNFVARIRPF